MAAASIKATTANASSQERRMSTQDKLELFTCTMCGHKTVFRSGMEEHMKTHGTRKASRHAASQRHCLLCNFAGLDRQDLECHMFSHTEELGDLLLCRVGDITEVSPDTEQPVTTHTGGKPSVDVKSDNKAAQNANVVLPVKTRLKKTSVACDKGDFTTQCKETPQQHRKTHKKKTFECDVCAYRTTNETAFGNHRGEQPFKCGKCPYSVSCKRDMYRHMQTHTGERVFSCGHCDYKTAWKSLLTNHFLTNTLEKPFHCEECGYTTKCKRARRAHLKDHTYTCKKCAAVLASKEKMEKHMKNHRKEETQKASLCEVCGYQADCRTTLEVHKRKHTGEKPFACDECDYRTAYKTSLKNHRLSHHELAYQCGKCGFRTNAEASLEVHMREHRRFTCGDCDFVTSSRKDIDAHLRAHDVGGAATIMCGKCRQFWTSCTGKMGAHMQAHNGDTL